MIAMRRVCSLCGRVLVILLPAGAQEEERDKLCGECATLPKAPAGAEEAPHSDA